VDALVLLFVVVMAEAPEDTRPRHHRFPDAAIPHHHLAAPEDTEATLLVNTTKADHQGGSIVGMVMTANV
jgi:hypothetical protein